MNQFTNYIVKEKQLIIDNYPIVFNYPIRDVVQISDMLIVRIEPPVNKIYNENVFGVNSISKKVIWQIEKRGKKYPGLSKNCPFTSVKIHENNILLYNWCDFYLIVDPQNGHIIEENGMR